MERAAWFAAGLWLAVLEETALWQASKSEEQSDLTMQPASSVLLPGRSDFCIWCSQIGRAQQAEQYSVHRRPAIRQGRPADQSAGSHARVGLFRAGRTHMTGVGAISLCQARTPPGVLHCRCSGPRASELPGPVPGSLPCGLAARSRARICPPGRLCCGLSTQIPILNNMPSHYCPSRVGQKTGGAVTI